MSESESAARAFRINWQVVEVVFQVVSRLTVVIGLAGLMWLGLGATANVVIVSILASGSVYLLETVCRDWLILSDDTESVEIATGETKLLRTLQRLPSDHWRANVLLAVVSAATGCAVGFAVIWFGAHPLLACFGAGFVAFFLLLFVYIKRDQRLAREYVIRGHQAYLDNDLSAAMGDASESMILSLGYRYEAHMIRGLVWMRLEAYDRAVHEFREAHFLRPDLSEATTLLRAARNPQVAEALVKPL